VVKAARAACVHVWDIATAAGPISPGTCRFCGEYREFANSSEHLVGPTGMALDFRSRPAVHREEEPVARANVHQRHKEIEKQWPEIKRTLEETGRLNRTAVQLGLSYSSVERITRRHGLDTTLYRPMAGVVTNSSASGGKADKGVAPARHAKTPAPAREKTAVGEGGPAGAVSLANIGQGLIGLGLIMVGAWLKSQEE
jgi:hypothetical protein